jgi:hypothetical protein
VTTPLAKRLGVLPGSRVRLINAPAKYVKSLGRLPDGALLAHKGHEPCDVVHVFARSVAELRGSLPEAVKSLRPNGTLWISYPKKTSGAASDITRDATWEVLSELGMHPVAQIALDRVWAALRFRPDAPSER